ncbi:MAG: hypothetical protein IH974_11505 [Myxococcales bacterium]|nr:hypothetical protein [Myxococcales bacterium]
MSELLGCRIEALGSQRDCHGVPQRIGRLAESGRSIGYAGFRVSANGHFVQLAGKTGAQG